MRPRLLVFLIIALALAGCRRAQPEVVVEPATLALDVEPGSVRLEPGLTTKVKVAVTRSNFAGPFRLELLSLPTGLTATAVNIEADTKVGEIELTAAPNLVPGEKTGIHAFGSAAEVQASSKAFSVTVTKPTISYTFEPTHLKIPQGETRTLKVTIERGREAYKGPVEITLANLPKNVTATVKGAGPEGADWAVFSIQAGASAPEGPAHPVVRVIGAKEVRGAALFPLTVQGEPFVLKAEPGRVNSVFGQSTKVKITAVRRDYQGPIAIKMDALPGNLKAKTVTLAAKQTSAEIELTAPFDAISAQKTIQVRGDADDSRHAKTSFELKVEGRPFILQVQPARLEVVQGTSAKFKVIAIRAKDYTGAIDLDLRNLPVNVKASSRGIAAQEKSADVEISAADFAERGPANLQIVGTARVGTETREITYDKFGLVVQPPFSVVVQPAKIELVEGQKTTVKVSAIRRTYQGVIALEMKNLPAGVTASEAEIPRDKTSVDIELSAGPGTSGKIRPNVHALGTSIDKKNVPSGNVSVAVLSRLFELKVDKAAKVTFGGTTSLKVTALRKEYDGPIALEMKNLPKDLKAAKIVLPAGQSEIDVEVSAVDQAKESTTDVHVLGTATAFGNQQRASGNLALQVVPGLFDLKLDTNLVQLHHGGSAKLIVIALRKGHDGPIAVELKNLPMKVSAGKVTIPQGETRAEVEVKADLTVNEGAKIDAFARGSVTGKTVDSSRFTVNVGSVGQAPRFTLKVEPATIKLTPGASVKVKVVAIRKDYTGPIAVDLRNLPAEVESSKGMIAAGASDVEITLTARPKAEPGLKADVCAVGIATAAENMPFASPQLTVQVGRK